MSYRVNITPALEQIFGVANIKSKADLLLLIEALEESDSDNIFDTEAMAKTMESFQKKRFASQE